MSVRAKFKVHNVRPMGGESGGSQIELHPVYSSDPESENGKFFKATPWGSISLGTVNAEAAAQFPVGQEVYVDFTPVEG